MLIGIDARMYGSRVTGIGNYVKNLTDNLFLIDKENHYVLFMGKEGFAEFTPPNARVSKILTDYHWYTMSEQTKLFRQMEKIKADLFHFPNFNVPLFYTRNFVVTIHDITPKYFPGPKTSKSLLRKLAYETVFRSAMKRSEKIITVSNYSKESIIKDFKVPADKINVVYNGLSPAFQRVTNCGIIKQLEKRNHITLPFIFYTGVLRPHKNIVNLIKAFEILINKQNFKLQLVIGGELKNQDPKIDETIKALNLDKSVIKTGYISDEDLVLFYSAAQITVVPSFCEGFGLVALESLACQTPVAVSKTTSMPEILGQASLYFDPANPKDIAGKIKEILIDDNLKNNLLTAGRGIIKKYTWESCAKQTLDIYNKVLLN